MNDLEKIKKIIDVDKIIKEKDAKLHNKMPGFVIRYLKKIIHQDEINILLHNNRNKEGIDLINDTFREINVSRKLKGTENIPDDSRYIFVANHPIGSLDGIGLINELYEHYGEIKAVVNDILMNIEKYHQFFVGVNKHGTTARENIIALTKLFDSNTPILFFPAGLASRREKGKIRDTQWKKTFVTRAIKHKRDIIPVHVSGQLSNFFYNLYSFRKVLGIKANIEMLYLVNEQYKQRNKEIVFTFGKPIKYTDIPKGMNHLDVAEKIRQHIYEVEKNENTELKF